MSVKSVVLTVVIVISTVIISALISNYISEQNLRTIDLPAVSSEKERGQPAKALESIAVPPAPKVEYRPVSEGSREIKAEDTEETISDMSDDGALTDAGTEAEDEGPPAPKTVKPLPVFEPIVNETGPIAQDSDKTYGESPEPEPTEQYSSEEASVGTSAEPELLSPGSPVTDSNSLEIVEQNYTYGGPPIPYGLKTKPLPPFTPISNKTGPVVNNKNRY